MKWRHLLNVITTKSVILISQPYQPKHSPSNILFQEWSCGVKNAQNMPCLLGMCKCQILIETRVMYLKTNNLTLKINIITLIIDIVKWINERVTFYQH